MVNIGFLLCYVYYICNLKIIFHDGDFNDNRNTLYEIVMEFLETAGMNDLEYFDEYIQLSEDYEIYGLSSLSELFSSFFFPPEILSNLKFNH